MQANLSEIESDRKITFRSMESLPKRLKHLRKVRGDITQQQFADAIGVTRGAVGNWERISGDAPDRDNLAKIADHYRVSLDWLQKGVGEPPGELDHIDSAELAHLSRTAPMAAAMTFTEPLVPLLGQGAAGKDGRFLFNNGEPAAWLPTPPRLIGVPKAYAVRVFGDSMEAEYFSGEIVFVHPTLRPEKGSLVVAQMVGEEGAPPSGYVKRFLSQDARELRLEQTNPRKVLTFPARKVVSVHRIIKGGEE